MRLMKSLFLFSCLSTGIVWAQSSSENPLQNPLHGSNSNAPTSSRSSNPLPLQPWQVRRAAFGKTVKGMKEHDPDATKDFDAILTQFETQPFARTPMENMDIMGVFYAPKDDAEGVLTIASTNAVLGWYDALRFGSESGRAEIVSNEKFFGRAFLLSGPATTGKFKEFRKEHPDLVRKAVLQGLVLAERERKNPHYDVHWPTSYGLERLICAQGGACNPIKEMPTDQWDKAWEDAKARVITYYTVDSSTSSTK